MAKKKKKQGEDALENETETTENEGLDFEVISGDEIEEELKEPEILEDNQVVKPVKKEVIPAKMPQVKKGIAAGKITFDIFFSYCLKKFPDKVRIDHYRAMKNYLSQKNYATIDTKDGFCKSFVAYGLLIT